jgi:hypothetical protein
MKNKINLIGMILAMFVLGNLANAQADKETKVSLSQTTVAKLYTTIAFLETKPNYKKGMTKSNFLKNCFDGVPDFPVATEFKEFLGYIYELHKTKRSSDEVYVLENGENYYKFHQSLRKDYVSERSTDENLRKFIFFELPPNNSFPSGRKTTWDIFFSVGTSSNNNIQEPKHGWLNLIRKIIVILDDEFPKK